MTDTASLPDRLGRFAFFTGKGGVGKTSLACACALDLAGRGRRVLLVSTDPASNLGDVLGVRATGRPEPVPGFDTLRVLDVDPIASAAAYRERVVGPYRGVLPDDAVARMEEELSGACTVEVAAFDEFTALLTDAEILAEYDHVLFDTAPTGHTLRLLRLPAAWTGFIESNTTGVSCLGPLAGLEKQRDRYARAVASLADAELTSLVLVARPEGSTLREAERTRGELAALGVENLILVINGRFRASDPHDPFAVAVERRGEEELARLPAPLAALERVEVPLLPRDTVGPEALRELLAAPEPSPAQGDDEMQLSVPPLRLPSLGELVDDLEARGPGLVMTMGKGGVGKTTVAAAIAVELAARGHAVHLTTTDPAAHLAEALEEEMPNLRVGRIDPEVETAAYRSRVIESAGGSLDERGRAVLEEDLRSPCTEEVAVFQAFARTVAEAEESFVVLDTAPTGHTLLLMDATGSYHRQLERQSRGTESGRELTTLERLRDPERTRVLIVTLPETTPVLEASRLQADLARAGIGVFAWVLNRLWPPAAERDPVLRRRAAAQTAPVARVVDGFASRVVGIPMSVEGPRGVAALRRMVTVGERTPAIAASLGGGQA